MHSGTKVQTDFKGSVEIPGVAGHDKEDNCIGAVRVVVIDESANEVDNSVVLRECPAREEGGGGGGGKGEKKEGGRESERREKERERGKRK